MKTDYKFGYISRDDNGFIIKAMIRFYEGEVIPVRNTDPVTNEKVVVNAYVRYRKLNENDLSHLGKGFVTDGNNSTGKIYTPADFGSIQTDSELCVFLDAEIAKDKTRKQIK